MLPVQEGNFSACHREFPQGMHAPLPKTAPVQKHTSVWEGRQPSHASMPREKDWSSVWEVCSPHTLLVHHACQQVWPAHTGSMLPVRRSRWFLGPSRFRWGARMGISRPLWHRLGARNGRPSGIVFEKIQFLREVELANDYKSQVLSRSVVGMCCQTVSPKIYI